MVLPTSYKRESDATLRIFREIDRSPAMSQRELSSRVGVSLGRVNFLINALIGKGFVRVENVKAPSRKSAYHYFLTPAGLEEKARSTYLFLQRKIREYERLGTEIRQLRKEVRANGAPSRETSRRGR